MLTGDFDEICYMYFVGFGIMQTDAKISLSKMIALNIQNTYPIF